MKRYFKCLLVLLFALPFHIVAHIFDAFDDWWFELTTVWKDEQE